MGALGNAAGCAPNNARCGPEVNTSSVPLPFSSSEESEGTEIFVKVSGNSSNIGISGQLGAFCNPGAFGEFGGTACFGAHAPYGVGRTAEGHAGAGVKLMEAPKTMRKFSEFQDA